MEQGRPKFDRNIYVLKNVKNCTEIKEKAAKFICNNNDVTRKTSIRRGKREMTIDLGKIKFVVCPIKNKNYKEEIKIVKTEKIIDYGKIKIDKKMEQFKTDLCFIICYSSNKRFNFIFEELIDHVVGKIDIYSKL